MCTTCGCSGAVDKSESASRQGHHHHEQNHSHPEQSRIIEVEQRILAKNDAYARDNRERMQKADVTAFNLVSSPGSGKTTLLVETIRSLGGETSTGVIEGDQQTSLDADRIQAAGARALQINTGKGCHLDAHQVGHALDHFELSELTFLFIENVGNLVCPAAFDLGEKARIVMLSVTEGEDKPLKYPDMFAGSDLMLINKSDLLPYVDFSVERCIEYARRINPDLEVLVVSATRGEGMGEWLQWCWQKHSSRQPVET